MVTLSSEAAWQSVLSNQTLNILKCEMHPSEEEGVIVAYVSWWFTTAMPGVLRRLLCFVNGVCTNLAAGEINGAHPANCGAAQCQVCCALRRERSLGDVVPIDFKIEMDMAAFHQHHGYDLTLKSSPSGGVGITCKGVS